MTNDLTITKITVHCPTDTMGETPEPDASGYRVWLGSELAAKYPGAEIDVDDQQSTYAVQVSVADEDSYYTASDDVNDFCRHCWDHSPWSWVS